MRRNHRNLSFFVIPIFFAALIGCGDGRGAAAGDAANAPVAAVVKVARGNIADNLEIASEFQPFQEVDVYAKVSGYIQKLYVDYGTHVKQGQILAVLEIPELQQQLQQDRGLCPPQRPGVDARSRRFEPGAIGVHRRAPYLYAACRRAEVAPGAYLAGGNRRFKGQGHGSGRGRVGAESGACRGRGSIDCFQRPRSARIRPCSITRA